jgi:multidrug resistance efflux pump
MLIIAILYVGIAWLVFFRFKWLPWNWPWRIATALLGCAILTVFIALLNTLTPPGRIAVVGRVVEVTPNIAGTVTSIPVEPNELVKAGTVLFQIDPAPYNAKVKQLRAAVAEARQKVEQLKAQVDLAVAEVKGVGSQLDYAEKRRDDVERLAMTGATNQFALQDTVAKVDGLTAQVQAAAANIKPGAPVKLVFANRPGKVYDSAIADVYRGVGQGQVAVSGTLARAETVGTSSTYPAKIDIPKGVDPDMLRLGMVGTATVISDKAGPIGLLATILLWVKAYAAYL